MTTLGGSSCRCLVPCTIRNNIRVFKDKIGRLYLVEGIGPRVTVGRYCAEVIKTLTLSVPALDSPFSNSFGVRVSKSRAAKQAITSGALGRMSSRSIGFNARPCDVRRVNNKGCLASWLGHCGPFVHPASWSRGNTVQASSQDWGRSSSGGPWLSL